MVDEKRQPAAVKAAKPAAKTTVKPSKPAAAKADPGRRYRGVSEAARQAERRQRFIEAGLTVFGSRGYHSSTVRSICSEAGLTERYFYESFANSEDLLCVVYEHVNQRIRERILATLLDLPQDPAQIARAVLTAFLECMRDDPRMARMLFVEVLGVSDRVDALYRESVENFAGLLIRLSQPLLDARELPAPLRPEILGVAMLGSVIAAVSRWMLQGFHEPVEVMAANLHAVFVAVIRHLVSEAVAPGASASE